MNFYENIYATESVSPQTIAAAASVNGGEVDCAGASEVMAIVYCGAISASSTLAVHLEEATASGGSFSDITGATVSFGATDDDKIKCIRIKSDKHSQFIRAVAGVTGGTDAIVSVAIVTDNKVAPVTQDETGVDVETL